MALYVLTYRIKSSFCLFYFGNTNNDPSNVDPTAKAGSTYVSINGGMILVNISKRDKVYPAYIQKVPSIPNPYSTHKLKDIPIGWKFYHQVNTSFIYVSNHNHTHLQ